MCICYHLGNAVIDMYKGHQGSSTHQKLRRCQQRPLLEVFREYGPNLNFPFVLNKHKPLSDLILILLGKNSKSEIYKLYGSSVIYILRKLYPVFQQLYSFKGATFFAHLPTFIFWFVIMASVPVSFLFFMIGHLKKIVALRERKGLLGLQIQVMVHHCGEVEVGTWSR